MKKPVRILIIEHDAAQVELARSVIGKVLKHCTFQVVQTRAEFLNSLTSFQPDVILADQGLPRFGGMQALRLALKHAPLTPFIMWIDLEQENASLRYIEAGAHNCVVKEDLKRLGPAILHAVKERDLLISRKEAEEKYEAIFENSVVGIFQSSPDGRFLHANAALAQIYGYDSPEEMIEGIQDIATQIYVEPENRKEFEHLVRSQAAVKDYEQQNYRKDGSIIWTSTSARAVRASDGGILYYEGFVTDVTRRKQAEKALHEERNLLRTLIDHLPDLIYVMDREGRKTLSNKADWRACGGNTMEDVIGKTDMDLYPPELAEQFWKFDRAVMETGEALINFEEPGLDAEGNLVSVLTTKIPLRDERGNITGLVGIGRDITERKQAEAHIQELLAFNEKILNQSCIGILTYKATGQCVYANEQAAAIVGTEVQQLMAQNFRTVESWKKSGLYDLVEQALQAQTPVRGDIHHISTFGKDIWMTAHCVTFRSKEEEHVVLFVADISDRKQAEAALRFEKERFESITATVPGILCSFRLRPDGTACLPFASPAIQDVLGLLPEEVEHDFTPVVARVHPEDVSHLQETIEESARTMLPWHNEFRYQHPIKGEVWIEGQSMPLSEEDGSIIWHGFVHDITERKRAEVAEREQRVLAEALRDTAETLSRTLDYGEVLDYILATVERVVPHDAATVMLVNDGHAQIARAKGYEHNQFSDRIMQVQLSVSETANLRLMFETGEPVVIYDTHTYPGWKRLPETDWLRSSVGAPISIYGEVIGFILLDSQSPEFFKPLHAERLKAFANQAALAIHNARLLQQAQDEIAERRETELALIQSQGRYRELFHSSPISLWEEDFSRVKREVDQLLERGVTDLEGYFQHYPAEVTRLASLVHVNDVNQATLKLYGVSQKADLINTLDQIVRPEPLGDFHMEILGLLGPDRCFSREINDKTRQGEFLRVIVAGSIPHGYEEDWSKVIVSISDITELKQAEEALRESETKAKALLNAIPDLMFRLDREGTILDYKANHEDLYAQSVPTLTHQKMRDITPPDFANLIESYTRQTLESKTMQVFEYQLPVPGRGLRDYEARMVASGKDEVTAIVRDITEQKRNEAETRRRADEFAALYKTARELTALYELPGLLNTIAERASSLLHSTGSGIYLYDEARDDLELVLSLGAHIPAGSRLKLGEGLAGHVAQIREALIVDDYSAWSGRAQQYDGMPFRAVLEAPMLYGGQLIGVLLVHEMGESERKYTEMDAHLLSLFAEYAAGAVHAARLMQETRRGAEKMAALLETFMALTNLDLKATLQTIGNSARTIFSGDGCRIFLMEGDGEYMRCVLALQEDGAALTNLRVKLGEGVTGAVALSGKAEIVKEMHKDPRSIQIPGTPEDEAEAIMFAPLKEHEKTIGVLSIRRAGAGQTFQPGDLELLEAFASMAASAVSKAHLFEETQRRLAELEALYENGLAVGRLLKPAEIGDRVIETFARYLRWHHVVIRLRRGDSDDLEVVSFNLPDLKEEEQAHTQQRFGDTVTKVGQGLSGWAIQTGRALRTGNVHNHPQYVSTQEGIQSGLYMPLKVGERVIGVISVESEERDAFSEQDQRLLATLASQAAIAFENARLYQAIEQELTERKRAEDALRSSETHYRELADSITDVLFELDHNLYFTHWNKATELLTGVPAEDAIGRSMLEIFGTSEEQTRIGHIYEDVLKNRQPRTLETRMLIHGETRFFEINAYPSTRGVSVVANDVTERRRSELIMQKRFELMEYAAHHDLGELMRKTTDEISDLTGSTLGFFHFLHEDQKTLGLETWSTNTLQWCRVSRDEAAHNSIDRAGLWAEAVRQRRPLIQNDCGSLVSENSLPQGHVPIVRQLVIPVIRNEKVMAVLGLGNKLQDYTTKDLEIAARLADYAWDVTERKQMEMALETERRQLVLRVEERTADLSRANSNLARALRVKDEFLANMSHELRTPLNAILGLSESLGEQIAGPLNEKQQKYITTISESGHHLLALINDILDLAKIEAGQIILDINKVDIHTVCQSSLRMIKQLAQKKNQEVSLNIEDSLGLMWADERRLKQMIVNLLGNAVKFTPENGKVGLEVQGDREANKITITVWDTGIGISEEDLNRLFQPFVQLDSGLARETTGTGLGLALVAQMARLHGGSVSAASEIGKGSRFSIVLPWEPALALDNAARMRVTGKFPAIKPEGAKKPTILLVEDTKEVTMMIQDYLELVGYRIVTAQDGVDAIVQAKLAHPALILMDVQMPRMDGLEATRKLRGEAEFRYTPIIALTALAMPNDRERCLAAGMDEYVSKPVNLKALAKLIQSCLFNNGEARPQ